MMRSLSKSMLVAAVAILCSCGHDWQTGDLIFLRDSEGMGEAISDATGEVTHVGIILCTDSGTFVVDATPQRGVALSPIADFLRDNPNHELVRPRFEYNKPFFLNTLRLDIGAPYDSAFLPGNQAYYCSELVWDCYRDPQGRPLVPTQPMNFRDSSGHMPQFWVDWFSQLGLPVPEGVPGTNPNDLYRWVKNEALVQK